MCNYFGIGSAGNTFPASLKIFDKLLAFLASKEIDQPDKKHQFCVNLCALQLRVNFMLIGDV